MTKYIYNVEMSLTMCLEAPRPRDPQQDVHQDWLLVLAREESSWHDLLAEVLLSIYQRKQVRTRPMRK